MSRHRYRHLCHIFTDVAVQNMRQTRINRKILTTVECGESSLDPQGSGFITGEFLLPFTVLILRTMYPNHVIKR